MDAHFHRNDDLRALCFVGPVAYRLIKGRIHNWLVKGKDDAIQFLNTEGYQGSSVAVLSHILE